MNPDGGTGVPGTVTANVTARHPTPQTGPMTGFYTHTHTPTHTHTHTNTAADSAQSRYPMLHDKPPPYGGDISGYIIGRVSKIQKTCNFISPPAVCQHVARWGGGGGDCPSPSLLSSRQIPGSTSPQPLPRATLTPPGAARGGRRAAEQKKQQ